MLSPGGRFLCLEFSRVDVPLLERSMTSIPSPRSLRLASRRARQRRLRYLVESIRRFPDQQAFMQLIQKAGFERVRYRNLTGGIAAIHSAWRI